MTLRAGVCWLAVLAVLATAANQVQAEDKNGKTLAHIKISGSMEEGVASAEPLFGSLEETFKHKLDRIRKARKDDNVQALLLEIDGPSLGLARIEELCRAIAETRKSGKKVYAFTESPSTGAYLVAPGL